MTQQMVRAPRPPTPYDMYMEAQGLPIVEGLGLHDLNDLPLGPWKRLGARGAFIQLDGMEGVTGLYAVEVPAAQALTPERHLYEEVMYVAAGHGSTEVWKDGASKRQAFEWQPGSVFAIPLNSWHRLVNATSSPALVLALTNAPFMMDTFHNEDFIFNNPYDFSDRYDARDDYFKAREAEWFPELNEHIRYSNVIPDVVNCELPVDDRRGPGRLGFFSLEMAENILPGHVAEYPVGRYVKGHSHFAGATLICLRGQGYSIAWPCEYGTRPWEVGLGEFVKHQDYAPGGLVSPGTGWFHQHFNTGKQPLRLLALRYGSHKWSTGFTRAHTRAGANVDIKQGGRTIEHRDEDPQIRADFKRELAKDGIAFQMPDSAYQ